VIVRDCTVDMLGNRLGQGIDISFNMGKGMSMVEGCTIVGGMIGITTHSSMTEIVRNRVSRTTGQAISVAEMSMGSAMDNQIRDALGVGLSCDDQSMCMFEHNTVVGTRPDRASGDPTRRGFGVLASFYSEASLWQNRLAANPVAAGAVMSSTLKTTSQTDW
jgi:Right handed beta helix region